MIPLQLNSTNRESAIPGARGLALMLWILTVGVGARLTILVRQRTEFDQIDPLAMLEIFLVGCTGLILLVSRRLGPLMRTLKGSSSLILMLYYVMGMVSAAWSPLPAFSLFRAVEALSQIVAIFVAVSLAPTFRLAEKRVLLVGGLVVFLGVCKIPALVGFNFSLFAWHTNEYSASAAMLAAYCVGELFAGAGGRSKFLTAVLCGSLACIALGTSSASTIAFLCGLVAAAAFGRKYLFLFCGMAAVVLVLALGGIEGIRDMLFPGKTEEMVFSLSGRTHLWDAYIEQIKQAVIAGNGFAVLSRITPGAMYNINCHNSVIAALGSIGLIGLATLLVWIGKCGVELVKVVRVHRPGALGCLAAIVTGLVNSQACAFLGEGWVEITIVFIGILALFALFVSDLSGRNTASYGARPLTTGRALWRRRVGQ
jgi:O-antigen ligase